MLIVDFYFFGACPKSLFFIQPSIIRILWIPRDEWVEIVVHELRWESSKVYVQELRWESMKKVSTIKT
jgi:hypothetical protein